MLERHFAREIKQTEIKRGRCMSIKSYEEVVKYLKSKKRNKHLLIGNGFSMAYDPNIFSYNALSRLVEDSANELLSKLFAVINNRNF